MIKKIKSIKNLAVFANYQVDGSIRDFNDVNILYGWNYSGKTSLSRLFYFLDKSTIIDSEFSNVEYKVILENSNELLHSNREISPLNIRVFNYDFIRDNLSFQDSSKKIKGIRFDIGEGTTIRAKIVENNKKIEKGISLKNRNKVNIERFDEFESYKFTNESRRIKNECFNSLIDFDKRHLKSIISSLNINNLDDYILTDSEFTSAKANSLSQSPEQTINIPKPMLSYETIASAFNRIVESTPKQTAEDIILSNDQDLFNWTKRGLEIYQSKDIEISQCAFCGNDLTKDRLNYLNSFYTNEAAILKSEIDRLKGDIEVEKAKVKTIEYTRISKNDITTSLRDEFENKKNEFETTKTAYLDLLDWFEAKLNEKNDKFLFLSMSDIVINSEAYGIISNWIDRISEILETHNTIVGNFTTIQQTARDKYKKHLVASFLKDENYTNVQNAKSLEERFQSRCDRIIKKYEKENATLSNQLTSIAKGEEEMNTFIKKFLNRDDIAIKVDGDAFVLKRGGNIAKNLSDGEKTAIAFSHFMVMLESLQTENKLKETIIFIDDPISSLDANHIAQVSSMINSFFYRKGLNPDNAEQVVNCFKQLFISTHNFEFFSFLKSANNFKRKKKDQEGKEHPTCNYYLIKRLNVNSSIIENIPKSLSKYNSEYVYLFSEIYSFKEENYPENKSYMMPNIIRRFLEVYTLIKLPGNSDEIDNRVKILIGEVNELKVLHTFSHFTDFQRVTQHNGLVFRLNEIVDDLFTLLDKDPQHYTSLKQGIGAPTT